MLGRVGAVARAVGDVRLDGEVRKEERVLVDDAHAALLGRHARDVRAAEQ